MFAALGVSAALLLACSSASATSAQTITFTSSAPQQAAAGESYEVSATSSSGLPVGIGLGGACSLIRPAPNSKQTLEPPPALDEREKKEKLPESPLTIYLTAAGVCGIRASVPANAEYAAAEASQSFSVGKDPSEQITFLSRPEASVGSVYHPTVLLSAGIEVSFSTTTPSVCSLSNGAITFAAVGTCTIDARQLGVPQSEPAEAEQSFAVAKGSQTIAFTSSAPVSATAGERYEVSAKASSGLPVLIGAEGACSLTEGHSEFHLGEEEEEAAQASARKEREPRSPQWVYLVGAGRCVISASGVGTPEYEAPARTSQAFPVARDPAPNFSFTTSPPGEARVGESYVPAERSSVRLDVYFSSMTPAVCAIGAGPANTALIFIAPGVCDVGVRQLGVTEAEPPEAQQSFLVSRTPRSVISGEAAGARVGESRRFTASYSAREAPVLSSATTSVCSLSPTGGVSTLPLESKEVHFKAAGTCTLIATRNGVPEAEESFTVARGSQRILIRSTPAAGVRRVGGPSYVMSAEATSGLPVAFASRTPDVCAIAGDVVTFLAGGTCTIEVLQGGDEDYEAAASVQQSLAVEAPRAGKGKLELGRVGVDRKTGAVRLLASLPSAGVLSWRLTYTRAAHSGTILFGRGMHAVATGTSFTITAAPTRAMRRILEHARRALRVEAVVTFKPSSGSAPTSVRRSIRVRLT